MPERGGQPHERPPERPALRTQIGVPLDPPPLPTGQRAVDVVGHPLLSPAMLEAVTKRVHCVV